MVNNVEFILITYIYIHINNIFIYSSKNTKDLILIKYYN